MVNVFGPDDPNLYIKDPRYVCYVMMSTRLGVGEFVTTVEYTHFPPDTPANDDFKFTMLEWEETLWIMMGFPKEMRSVVDAIADVAGLRIVSGHPVMFSGQGASAFPFAPLELFSIENKRGHPVYRNDSNVESQLRQAERATMQRIISGAPPPPKNS